MDAIDSLREYMDLVEAARNVAGSFANSSRKRCSARSVKRR
jgi:hypothetical protein